MPRVLKESWHEAFFKCVAPHTDAPDAFVTWSAISLIGAALKNNVFFEIGTYTLYPNQFIVLVGPPGVGKGTASNMIEDMISENKPNPLVNTLSDRITAEKIIERISDGWQTGLQIIGTQIVPSNMEHNCLLMSSEIRVLLGASDWMLEFLEEAWSKTTFGYQTKNKGSAQIDSMCCSLLAASVPDFLRNINKEVTMVITGGFSSRCLFIYADSPSKDLPWPEPLKKNQKSKALWDQLVIDLKAIAAMRGEFTVATDARIIFEDFLKKNRAAAKNDNTEAVVNFRARIKAHVLKLAMVLSASRSDSRSISSNDMYNAIAHVEKITVSLEKLFRGAGDSIDAENTARVQILIEKRGIASKKEILRALHLHMTSETLDRILMVLTYTDQIELYDQNKIQYYRISKNGRKP